MDSPLLRPLKLLIGSVSSCSSNEGCPGDIDTGTGWSVVLKSKAVSLGISLAKPRPCYVITNIVLPNLVWGSTLRLSLQRTLLQSCSNQMAAFELTSLLAPDWSVYLNSIGPLNNSVCLDVCKSAFDLWLLRCLIS